MTTVYFQMVAALVFVILLILGAGYLLRKKQNRFGLMDVVSYQSIGPKKGVAALKVGDEELDLSEKSGFADRLEKFRKTGSEDR
jgi:flagellar biogenesis protein FliO